MYTLPRRGGDACIALGGTRYMKSLETWIPHKWKPLTHFNRDVQCKRKCVLKSCQRKGIM